MTELPEKCALLQELFPDPQVAIPSPPRVPKPCLPVLPCKVAVIHRPRACSAFLISRQSPTTAPRTSEHCCRAFRRACKAFREPPPATSAELRVRVYTFSGCNKHSLNIYFVLGSLKTQDSNMSHRHCSCPRRAYNSTEGDTWVRNQVSLRVINCVHRYQLPWWPEDEGPVTAGKASPSRFLFQQTFKSSLKG